MIHTSIEMDPLDRTAADASPGFQVRKDLVRRYARQYPVPTYVVELFLGRYCASTDQGELEEDPRPERGSARVTPKAYDRP